MQRPEGLVGSPDSSGSSNSSCQDLYCKTSPAARVSNEEGCRGSGSQRPYSVEKR